MKQAEVKQLIKIGKSFGNVKITSEMIKNIKEMGMRYYTNHERKNKS